MEFSRIFLCLLFPSLHVSIRVLNWSLWHQRASQTFSLWQLDHTVLLCSCWSLIEDKMDSRGVVATFLKLIMHVKDLRADLHINLYFFDKKTPISYIWDLSASSNLLTCNPHVALASDQRHGSFRIVYIVAHLQTISGIQRDQQVLFWFCFVYNEHPWWYVCSNAVWKPTLYLAIKLTYLHVSQTVYTAKAWKIIWDKTLKY